jgi:SAM-dependent methyltransferase
MEEAYREDLAFIHDAGFGRFARGAAALLLEALPREGFDRGLVVDLGCGSGILSEALAVRGFEILGMDLSAAFIALARKRVPSGLFRVESLLRAQLPHCVAVAAVGECVNYLFDEHHSWEGVRQVLGRAFGALEPGGLLLFDVAEPGRCPGGKAKSHAEGEGWAVLVTAEEDHGLVTRHITSFRQVGDLYRRDHEAHRLRLLPRSQVVSWLQEIGFQVKALDGYGSVPFAQGHVSGFWRESPSKQGGVCCAEAPAALDRGGIAAFQSTMSRQRPRQVGCGVRRRNHDKPDHHNLCGRSSCAATPTRLDAMARQCARFDAGRFDCSIRRLDWVEGHTEHRHR